MPLIKTTQEVKLLLKLMPNESSLQEILLVLDCTLIYHCQVEMAEQYKVNVPGGTVVAENLMCWTCETEAYTGNNGLVPEWPVMQFGI